MNGEKENENRITVLTYVNEVNKNQRYWKRRMKDREEIQSVGSKIFTSKCGSDKRTLENT